MQFQQSFRIIQTKLFHRKQEQEMNADAHRELGRTRNPVLIFLLCVFV